MPVFTGEEMKLRRLDNLPKVTVCKGKNQGLNPDLSDQNPSF